MRGVVVLTHGWGYDASIWDAVRAELASTLQVQTLDFGFFGAPRQPEVSPGETVLAVGHSLGALWWLTQADIPWRRLLGISGFPRFTEAPDYRPAVAPRVLARMRTQFRRDPATVLDEFHARCGMPAPAGRPDLDRLDAGLGWLAEWDGRAALAARRDDVFALAGSDDAIVPAAMSTAAFSALTPGHLEFVAVPGHGLPLSEPALCAGRIERLLA
jgi:pimeloyl-[acyl-carrier protein] methyl ester esterase